MNLIEISALVLLLATAVLGAVLASTREKLRTSAAALESVRESARHYNDLFKEEERDHCKTSDRLAELLTALESANVELKSAKIELDDLRSAKRARSGPCHILLVDALSEEQIEQALAGTAESGTVKAILSHISTRMVRQIDAASDRPSAGFTADQRLHEAGGGHTLAELLRDLQSLTASRETPAKEAA